MCAGRTRRSTARTFDVDLLMQQHRFVGGHREGILKIRRFKIKFYSPAGPFADDDGARSRLLRVYLPGADHEWEYVKILFLKSRVTCR